MKYILTIIDNHRWSDSHQSSRQKPLGSTLPGTIWGHLGPWNRHFPPSWWSLFPCLASVRPRKSTPAQLWTEKYLKKNHPLRTNKNDVPKWTNKCWSLFTTQPSIEFDKGKHFEILNHTQTHKQEVSKNDGLQGLFRLCEHQTKTRICRKMMDIPRMVVSVGKMKIMRIKFEGVSNFRQIKISIMTSEIWAWHHPDKCGSKALVSSLDEPAAGQ